MSKSHSLNDLVDDSENIIPQTSSTVTTTNNNPQIQIDDIITESQLHTDEIQNRQNTQQLILMNSNNILPQLRKYNAQRTNRRLTQNNPPSYTDSTIVRF